MSYTFRLGDLPKLDLQVDRGLDFKAWKRQWDAYLSLSGLSGLTDETAAKQVQALTLCFSRETVTIVENLGLSRDQLASASEIVGAIQHYVEGQINESMERRNFRTWVQQLVRVLMTFWLAFASWRRHMQVLFRQLHTEEHSRSDYRGPIRW